MLVDNGDSRAKLVKPFLVGEKKKRKNPIVTAATNRRVEQ